MEAAAGGACAPPPCKPCGTPLKVKDGRVNRHIACCVATEIMCVMAIWVWAIMGWYHMTVYILIIIYLRIQFLWPTARVMISRSLRGLPLISLLCCLALSTTARGCSNGPAVFTSGEQLCTRRSPQMHHYFTTSHDQNYAYPSSRWGSADT